MCKLLLSLLSLLTLLAHANSGLDNFLKNYQAPTILKPDEAFQFSVEANPDSLQLQWRIEPAYYLYKKRMQVLANNAKGKAIALELPNGKLKDDQFFGESEVYYDQAIIRIAAAQLQGIASLYVSYQGCAEAGVCFTPQQQSVDLAPYLQRLGISNAQATLANTVATIPSVSEFDSLTQQLHQRNLLMVLLLFFVAGLLLSFTPCVFPMIPILSGIITHQGDSLNTQRALRISLIYVLAMSATFTVAGVIAGLLGENLQAAFQNPWIIASFAGVFVLLALSMFGFFTIGVPQSWQNRIHQLSNQQQGNSYIGVAIMGILSALIVGPCVTPPLAAALLYISQTGNAYIGGAALMMLGLGMGLPLILFGTAAGKWLPKSGAWMRKVNAVFGVGLLALAIWMLDRILPISVILLMWSSLLIVSAIYLGAFEPLDASKERSWNALFKGIGWISLLLGLMLMIGGLSGGQSILKPLTHLSFVTHNSDTTKASYFRSIAAGAPLQQALQQAQQRQQPTMVYFTADWCVTCDELDLLTFNEAEVIAAMGEHTIFKVDVSENNAVQQQAQQQRNVFGPPTIIFYDSNGKEIKPLRIIGLISAAEFAARINYWKTS